MAPFSYRALTSWKRLAPPGVMGEVADLVDDEQAAVAEEADLLDQAAFAFSAAEDFDQLGQGGAVDPPACLHGGDAERDQQVALAGARRAEEMHDLGASDEVELGERHDAVPVERGLEGEVEALNVFGGVSLAVFSETPMRRVSRVACSSESRVSMASARRSRHARAWRMV